ncbi:MAG TPA: hypothetical protein V6D22_09570, partial [Candidatus Obscuribacterales bacterium]
MKNSIKPMSRIGASILCALVLLAQLPSAAATIPANLNLASTVKSTTAPAAGVISIGGKNISIASGAPITPAEAMALSQVLSTGSQSLILSAAGRAIGGSAVLAGALNLSSLLVPRAVTIIRDASQSNSLSLTGDVTNSGKLYFVSTNSAVNIASVSAYDIVNNRGALLSSVLPNAGLAAIGNAISDLSLSLSASHAIFNAGTISSASNLTLSGGGTTPLLIANRGLIQATQGDINLVNGSDIIVNNAGGTIQAANGNINFRDASYTGSGNILLNSGNWIANNINLNSGQGTISGNIGNVVGVLNENANNIDLFANSRNLQLGNTTASGDPTFYNIGSITITGNVSATEDIAILATGSITADSSVTSISTSGTGSNITIVAGANISPNAPLPFCNGCFNSVGSSGNHVAGGPVTINPKTPLGGNIDFSQATLVID